MTWFVNKMTTHTKQTRSFRLIQVEAEVCRGASQQVEDNH